MRPKDKKGRTPTLAEFPGWYNLGYQRYDGLPLLQSADNIPPFQHREFFELYLAEREWFECLASIEELAPFDPLASPPFYACCDADDRTLAVDPHYENLTVEQIESIRTEFLGRHPLWRVVLSLESPANAIVVYPNAVRYGEFPINCDAAETLRTLVRRAIAERERRLLPRRAELRYLQQRLPEAVNQLQSRRCLVLGALENHFDRDPSLMVHVLSGGQNKRDIQLLEPAGSAKDFVVASGTHFAVNQLGIIVAAEWPYESVPYYVQSWLVPLSYRGPLQIVDGPAGTRTIWQLRAEDITRIPAAEPLP